MTRAQLVEQIMSKGTYLCVGLDTDINNLPVSIREKPDAVFEFNKEIINATLPHCVGYKINTAFYEAGGAKGWETMMRTVDLIPATHFKIADAKRGDIGNTSSQYARAFFEEMSFDAITVAPYMGSDSLEAFLSYQDKWTIVLGLTSNPGAMDFEQKEIRIRMESLVEGIHTKIDRHVPLYEYVMETVAKWGNPENLMFVVGATQQESFERIRAILPQHFYLVPGVGAQGGSLETISKKAMIEDCGLLVNASRAIIHASMNEDFAEAAANVASGYAREMRTYLNSRS